MTPQGQYKLSDVDASQQPASGKGQYSLMDVRPYAAGEKPASLPNITNEDLKRWGRTALDYLPAVAGTAGALIAPEVALPAGAGWLATTGAAVGGAAAAGAAGEAARQATLAATRDPNGPTGILDAAKNIGTSGLEQGAAELGGRIVAAPFEWGLGKLFNPERMYQSALKPSAISGPESQGAVVSSGLNGVPGPIPAGPLNLKGGGEAALATNRARISETNNAIVDFMRNNPRPGQVDPLDVASRLDDLKNGSFGQQALNRDDLKFIDQAKRQYLEKHGAVFDKNGNMTTPPQAMTGTQAQVEKVATYAQNEGKYGEIGRVQDESEKALARGLKENVARIYPELHDLNTQDGAMINLNDALERYVARHGNTAPGLLMKGVFSLSGAGGGAMLAGHPGALAGAMLTGGLMALDDPGIRSAVAIALKTRAAQMAAKGLAEAPAIAGRTQIQPPQQ